MPALRPRPGFQGVSQHGTGRDAQLRVDLVKMGADSPVGEEQTLRYLLVGQSGSGQPGCLQLLGRERMHLRRLGAPPAPAGGPQFRLGTLRPWPGPEMFERGQCGAERPPGFRWSPCCAATARHRPAGRGRSRTATAAHREPPGLSQTAGELRRRWPRTGRHRPPSAGSAVKKSRPRRPRASRVHGRRPPSAGRS